MFPDSGNVGLSCSGSINIDFIDFLKRPSDIVNVTSPVEFNKMAFDKNTVTPVMFKLNLYKHHVSQRLNHD